MQWDQSLKYRAVRLVFPVRVRAATLTGEEKAAIPVQTDKNVNADNKIDWYGLKGDDGAYYLSGLFYQTDVPARGPQRLQLYFPAAYLGLTADLSKSAPAASEPATQAEPEPTPAQAEPAPAPEQVVFSFRNRPLAACAVFLPIIFVCLALYTRRLTGFRKKKACWRHLVGRRCRSPPRILGRAVSSTRQSRRGPSSGRGRAADGASPATSGGTHASKA